MTTPYFPTHFQTLGGYKLLLDLPRNNKGGHMTHSGIYPQHFIIEHLTLM